MESTRQWRKLFGFLNRHSLNLDSASKGILSIYEMLAPTVPENFPCMAPFWSLNNLGVILMMLILQPDCQALEGLYDSVCLFWFYFCISLHFSLFISFNFVTKRIPESAPRIRLNMRSAQKKSYQETEREGMSWWFCLDSWTQLSIPGHFSVPWIATYFPSGRLQQELPKSNAPWFVSLFYLGTHQWFGNPSMVWKAVGRPHVLKVDVLVCIIKQNHKGFVGIWSYFPQSLQSSLYTHNHSSSKHQPCPGCIQGYLSFAPTKCLVISYSLCLKELQDL